MSNLISNEGTIQDFLERFYLLIFIEEGSEGIREVEKHQCMVASHVAPSGDAARSPGMCHDW